MTRYSTKSVGGAYLLWCGLFIGVAGLHHFYLGKPLKGLLWLFTWGLLGVGLVWDFFTMPTQVRNSY